MIELLCCRYVLVLNTLLFLRCAFVYYVRRTYTNVEGEFVHKSKSDLKYILGDHLLLSSRQKNAIYVVKVVIKEGLSTI